MQLIKYNRNFLTLFNTLFNLPNKIARLCANIFVVLSIRAKLPNV